MALVKLTEEQVEAIKKAGIDFKKLDSLEAVTNKIQSAELTDQEKKALVEYFTKLNQFAIEMGIKKGLEAPNLLLDLQHGLNATKRNNSMTLKDKNDELKNTEVALKNAETALVTQEELVTSLGEQIVAVDGQIASLNKDVEKFGKEMEGAQIEIGIATQMLNEIQPKIVDKENEINQQKGEIRDLDSQVENARSERPAIRQERGKARWEVWKTRAELVGLKIAKPFTFLLGATQGPLVKEALEKMIDDAEARHAINTQNFDKVLDKMSKQNEIINGHKATRAELNGAMQKNITEQKKLQAKSKELTSIKDKNEKKVKELGDNITKARDNIKLLENNKEKLNEDLVDAQSSVESIPKNITELNEKKEGLVENVENLEKSVVETEANMAVVSQLNELELAVEEVEIEEEINEEVEINAESLPLEEGGVTIEATSVGESETIDPKKWSLDGYTMKNTDDGFKVNKGEDTLLNATANKITTTSNMSKLSPAEQAKVIVESLKMQGHDLEKTPITIKGPNDALNAEIQKQASEAGFKKISVGKPAVVAEESKKDSQEFQERESNALN